jgi:hypothetical protein
MTSDLRDFHIIAKLSGIDLRDAEGCIRIGDQYIVFNIVDITYNKGVKDFAALQIQGAVTNVT